MNKKEKEILTKYNLRIERFEERAEKASAALKEICRAYGMDAYCRTDRNLRSILANPEINTKAKDEAMFQYDLYIEYTAKRDLLMVLFEDLAQK